MNKSKSKDHKEGKLEETLKQSDVNSTKLIEIYNQLNSDRKNNVYNYASDQLNKQKMPILH